MIKLLRGDDAKHLITLDLPEVAFSEGMTVIFEIGGLKVTAPAAPSIEVQFPSTWTALQPCGRLLGSWKIRDRNGNIGTLTKTFPIFLTDDVGEITSGSIVSGNVKPVVDFSDIAELTTSATPGDVKAALNEILRRLKTGLSCLLIAFAIPAFSAELTPDTIMDEVPGTTTLSNLVSAAGVTVGGGTDGNAVTNIATGLLHHKVFPEVDRKRDIDELGYGKPVVEDFADFIVTVEGEEPVRVPWNHAWQCYQLYGKNMINIQIQQAGKFYMLAFWIVGDGDDTFTDAMVREYPITEFVFGNGKYRGKIDKKYPDRLALKSEVLSKEEVKETIRETNGGVWDQKLEVWWTPKMENGKLTYQATTNINLKVEK